MLRAVGTQAAMADAAPAAFAGRLKLYLDERFPPGIYALLIGLFALACSAFVQAAAGSEPVRLSLRTLVAGIVVFLAFFHLRCFDEAKDAEGDRALYPDRVLSRGIVTLQQISRLGYAAIAVQALLAASLGAWPFWAWAVAFYFSLLMRWEFFAPNFLRGRMLLYAVTHNPVVGLLAVFVTVVELGDTALVDHMAAVGWLFAIMSVTSLAFEVGRKVRAPEETPEGAEFYNRALGLRGALSLLAALGVLSALVLIRTMKLLHPPGWHLPVALLLALPLLLASFKFARAPQPGGHKKVEGAVSLLLLGVYLWMAALPMGLRGVRWELW